MVCLSVPSWSQGIRDINHPTVTNVLDERDSYMNCHTTQATRKEEQEKLKFKHKRLLNITVMPLRPMVRFGVDTREHIEIHSRLFKAAPRKSK